MTFTFTDAWTNLDSSLVKGVYHDADKRMMLVRLDGDKQYVYTNTDKNEAERVATAPSKGRAYNDFRRFRKSWQKGSVAHGEIVAPKETVRRDGQVVSASARRVQVGQPVNAFGSGQWTISTGVTSTFEVDFKVGDSTHTSTVVASNLVSAVTDVQAKLNALGLNATMTGVRLKV